MKAYKEKHGHLHVDCKEDPSLYGFCNNMRQARRDMMSGKGRRGYKLDDGRIAALDAIGFNWGVKSLSTTAYNVTPLRGEHVSSVLC